MNETKFIDLTTLQGCTGTELYVVIQTYGDYTLIRRNTTFQPWVVAWCYKPNEGYWCQGHYFEEFSDAVDKFCKAIDERR